MENKKCLKPPTRFQMKYARSMHLSINLSTNPSTNLAIFVYVSNWNMTTAVKGTSSWPHCWTHLKSSHGAIYILDPTGVFSFLPSFRTDQNRTKTHEPYMRAPLPPVASQRLHVVGDFKGAFQFALHHAFEEVPEKLGQLGPAVGPQKDGKAGPVFQKMMRKYWDFLFGAIFRPRFGAQSQWWSTWRLSVRTILRVILPSNLRDPEKH